MPRLVQALVVVALFIGLGFVTRPLFREWMETNIKEAEAASRKETAKWKAAETPFKDVKFDKPITTTFEVPRQALPPRRK
jgi:hypothetical protein